MSEYLAAHLTIGGPIPQPLVKGLCTAIAQSQLSLNWGEPPWAPQSSEELLASCMDLAGARVLRLYDEEARWGEFPELEAWLVRRRIAFDRFNEGKYEISAERLVFRPGGGSVVYAANAQEQVVCEAEPLWPLADLLTSAQQALRKHDSTSARRSLTAAERIFREAVPSQPPPLLTLTFVTRRPRARRI